MNDTFHSEEVTLNITDEEESLEWIEINYTGPEEYNHTFTFEEDDDLWENGYFSHDRDVLGESSGSYNISVFANETNEEDEEIVYTGYIEDVVIDSTVPSRDRSPRGAIDHDEPEVEITFEDTISGLENATLEVLGENETTEENLDGSQEETLTIDYSDESLDTGTYDVEWSVYDFSGNKREGDWTFTVSTDYEGDTNPDFDPSPGLFTEEEWEDDYSEYLVLILEETGDEVTDKEVTCYDGSGDEIDSDSNSIDGDTEFDCRVRMSEYGDSNVDIYAEICNEAGYCEETSTESYTFDGSPPTVIGLDTVSGHYVFNDNFDVEFEAFDDTAGVDQVEYYFEPGDEGEGYEVEYESGTIEFEADTSDLDMGENTLYVRAQDILGQWSTAEVLDFEYYPDEGPEVEIETDKNITTEAGSSENLDLTVENTGMFFIEDLEVEGYLEDIFEQTETVQDLDNGSSVSFTWTVDTEDGDLGEHSIEVSSDSPPYSTEVPLIVDANEEQMSEIDQQFSTQQNNLEQLRQNITDLEQDGLSDERSEEVETSITAFEQRVNDAEQAIEEGKYYEADEHLSGISSDFSEAETSYQEVRSDHVSAQRTRMIGIGLFLLVLTVSGAAAFFAYNDDYDFNFDSMVDSDLEMTSLGGIESRIKAVFKNEEEAEEFAWNGFRD